MLLRTFQQSSFNIFHVYFRLRTVLDDIISNNVNKNNVIIYVETKIWAKKLTEIIALRYHLVECIDDSEIQQEICVRTGRELFYIVITLYILNIFFLVKLSNHYQHRNNCMIFYIHRK